MTFIRKKTIKGRTYYYLVKSQRVEGKVKQLVLEYLGAKEPNQTELRKITKKTRENPPRTTLNGHRG